MFSFKKRLNSKGFGHIELALFVIVVAGLSSVGYYVYKHSLPTSVNTYTTLTAFVADGIPFTEKACIASQTGSAPNYNDIVTALISVNEQAGPRTQVFKSGKAVAGSGYNPLAYYSIDGIAPITQDNWVTAPTSTIEFNLVPSIPSATFSLGVESAPNSAIPTSGSSQSIGSLVFCNAPAKAPVTTPTTKAIIPVIKTTTSGPVTTTTTTVANPLTNKTTTTVTTVNTDTKKTTTTTTTTPTPPVTPVVPVIPVTPAPTISLSALPTSLSSGSTSTLTWHTTNATSCTASGAWSGSKSTSGSITTSALSSTSNYTLTCSGGGGTVIGSVVVTVTVPPTSGTCVTSPPTVSPDPLYPLQQVVSFTGSSLPSQWQDYGNEIQAPSGYVAANHAVFVPGGGLQLKGYVDSISGSVGGVTGASGDVAITVASSGGFDACVSMTGGNWQSTQLVIISWPNDNVWGEGENDIFDGGGTGGPAYIYVHEIGSNPANNTYIGTWPNSSLSGAHNISSRWDPVRGYRFYLDGTLIASAPISSSVKTPTTPHHFAIQLQDMGQNSTNPETATLYWVASYGYN